MGIFWQWLRHVLIRLWRRLKSWNHAVRRSRGRPFWLNRSSTPSRKIFAQPKPAWVKQDIIRLKTLLPQAGCRTIAHTFNRRWKLQRQMTVSKTYVADTIRRNQYQILHARQKLKHRIPRPISRNRVWGCDLLVKTDRDGRTHLALAILDHGSRACLRLQRLADKSSWTLLQELVQAVKSYGRPQFVRTDNEAVFVSRIFRIGLCLSGIQHQRIDPGCPWQNGRVERFIGTVKRALSAEPIAHKNAITDALQDIRVWYNHERPHDHLQGRTPAEVWVGVDVFSTGPG